MAKTYNQPLPTSSCRWDNTLFASGAHRGLIWDRFFEGYNRDLFFEGYNRDFSGFLEIKEKKKNGRIVTEAQSGKADFVKRFNGGLDYEHASCLVERIAGLAKALNGWVGSFHCEGRFVTGMGIDHPTENGFTWHHTLGAPYLPGAAIKGLLRGWLEWQWGNEAIQKNGDELKRAQLLQWLGSEHKLNSEKTVANKTGWFIFFDALPVGDIILAADVMTPHFGKWYEKGGEEMTPETIPADWHSPVPITFLTVEQATLQFAVAIRPGLSDQERLWAQSALPSVMLSLEEALQWSGAGAKTAAGYGRFAPPAEDAAVQNTYSIIHQASQAQQQIAHNLYVKEQHIRVMEKKLKKGQHVVQPEKSRIRTEIESESESESESGQNVPVLSEITTPETAIDDSARHAPAIGTADSNGGIKNRLRRFFHRSLTQSTGFLTFLSGSFAVITLSWLADLLKEGPDENKIFLFSLFLDFINQRWADLMGWLSEFNINIHAAVLQTWIDFMVWLSHPVYLFHVMAAFILFLFFSWLTWRLSKNLMPLRSLSKGRIPDPHKVLILPLSTPGNISENARANAVPDELDRLLDTEWKSMNWREFLEAYRNASVEYVGVNGKSEQIDLTKWNGDNLILTLKHHEKKLERLVLITSKPEESVKDNKDIYNRIYRLSLFEKIVKRFFPKLKLVIRKSDESVNFDDVDDQYNYFNHEIEMAINKGYSTNDIMLDCTGGMKASSIAVALATLHHRDIEVQYIHTVTRDILSYNMQSMPSRRD